MIITKSWRNAILKMANKMAARERISLSYLGHKLADNSKFFDNLIKGKDCHVDTLLAVYNKLKGKK